MAASADIRFDDQRAGRNALILSVAQALYGCSTVVLIATGGLVGTTLAADRGLATLPITMFVIGTALTTIPASLLMRRVGRRAGFILGASAGAIGAVVCALAIHIGHFWLFAAASLLQGVYQAFSQYFRFAAADLASPAFRPKAISWVLAGGIAGALFVPAIIAFTKDLFGPALFIGTYLFSALTALVSIGVLALLDNPPTLKADAEGPSRPLSKILRQPRLIAAMLAGMTAYGVMNFVMTATPIAMVDCGFSVESSAWVIQWHALAMFAPSFFTGHLIARFGVDRIVLIGMALLVLAAISGLAGLSFAHFSVGLVLLGLGWNFGYIGGTAIVTESYLPAEKNKVQALNDFTIFAAVATASLVSGKILSTFGWEAVNWTALPAILLASVAFLVFSFLARSRAANSPATP
ncbi:MAG: MFS transporter [Parvibaculaceae bacterium]